MSHSGSDSDSDFKECNSDEEPSTRLSSSCNLNSAYPSFQEEPTTTEPPPRSKSLKDVMIIAVMGATGAGKSQFIRTLTGDNSVVVGNDLKSETVDVSPAWCRHPSSGREVILLDTPGFADTERTDTEILSAIATWLKETYKNDIMLTGILYLHRISDNRMTNVSVMNLKMLNELCGKKALANVVFVTTMWGKEEGAIAEKRQAQLEQTFWASMIKLDAQVARFGDTYADGWSIIDKFNSRTPRPLKIQREMVDEGKVLADTAAGAEVEKEMKKLIAVHEAKVKELTNNAKEARIAGEAATKSAVENAKRAEAAMKQAEEAVNNAQTNAAKAVAKSELKLAAERARLAEERAKEKQAAVDLERKMWREERNRSKAQLQALSRSLERLQNPSPAHTDFGVFDRIGRARDEGKRQAGFLGGLLGLGTAAMCEGLLEATAVCGSFVAPGRGDQVRKAYAHDMFDHALKESQKGGRSGVLGGIAGVAIGATHNMGQTAMILAGVSLAPRSEG